jgi:hypothetical protein
MNGTSRSVLSITIVSVVSLAGTSTTEGQCPTGTRAFASVGGGTSTDKLRIDPGGAENLGNETGRFWQSSDSSLGNNFDGGCPSQGESQVGGGWWQVSRTTMRGIEGWISGSGCIASSCPAGDLTVLVEEQNAVGDDAYFIAFRIDETPAELRRWDLSRTHAGPFPAVVTMERFPVPIVLGALNLGGGEFLLKLEFPDVAPNVHSASSVVKSYDLYRFTGDQAPGRDAGSWTPIGQWPYLNGPTIADAVVSCGAQDVYLALGNTFHGGAGPDVVSTLVGSSILIDCNPWFPPNPAGAVPDGDRLAGTPLMLDKHVDEQGLRLTLTWDAGCLSHDFDYGIYEGPLGNFQSHVPLYCSTGGGLSKTFQPADEETNAYYLVVPQSWQSGPQPDIVFPSREGSRGVRSNGSQRSPGAATCLPTWYGDCP